MLVLRDSKGKEYKIVVGTEITVVGDPLVGFGKEAAKERVLGYDEKARIVKMTRIWLNPKVLKPLFTVGQKYEVSFDDFIKGLEQKYIVISRG